MSEDKKKIYTHKKIISPIAFDNNKKEVETIEDKKYRLKASILNVLIASIIGFNIPSSKHESWIWPSILITTALCFNTFRMIYFWKRCTKCKKRNSMKVLKNEKTDFIDSENPWSDNIYFNEVTIEVCEFCNHKIKTTISKTKEIPGYASDKIKFINRKHRLLDTDLD